MFALLKKKRVLVIILVSIFFVVAFFVLHTLVPFNLTPASLHTTHSSGNVVPHSREESVAMQQSTVVLSSPTTRPERTPTATLARRDFLGMPAEKAVPTSFLPGQGPELAGNLVFSGRWLDFYVGDETFSDEQVVAMAHQAEYSLRYMERRFDERLNRRVSVGVYHPSLAPSSDTRGIAHTRSDLLFIYYTSDDDPYRALVILTHELAHQIQADAYGDDAQSRADLVLLEGLATWISGEYWLSLSGASSWNERSRVLLAAGHSAYLAPNGYNLAHAASHAGFDTAYELWAGFVDYLANAYGWEKFNALYVSGCGRTPGTADYEGIYGKSFNELVQDWVVAMQE